MVLYVHVKINYAYNGAVCTCQDQLCLWHCVCMSRPFISMVLCYAYMSNQFNVKENQHTGGIHKTRKYTILGEQLQILLF